MLLTSDEWNHRRDVPTSTQIYLHYISRGGLNPWLLGTYISDQHPRRWLKLISHRTSTRCVLACCQEVGFS